MTSTADEIPEPFFDRTRELAILDRAWQECRTQLVTMWGRRRVGKSALLSHFAQNKRAIYLYGTRASEREILAALALQASAVTGDRYVGAVPFPTWDLAFQYLETIPKDERLLIVLDEFPYICEATQGLDTLVQRWWDHIQHTTRFMLVIAGSAHSFMAGLTVYSEALHGRRTASVQVDPFDYLDAARFLQNVPAADRVRAYAFFGGMPAYLRHFDPDMNLHENLQRTLFAPGHVLYTEGDELLRTEFYMEAMYAAILRAIACGEQKPSDIARSVGKHSADEVFDYIRRLQVVRLIERETPITEWRQVRSRRSLYCLADPYLRAWFRFVWPNRSFLQLGQTAQVWEGEVAPHLDEFVARTTWEEVCMQHLWRRVATRTLPVDFTHLGRWWDNQDEIDLVGLWQDEIRLVGECKWTAAPVDERVLASLQRKAAKLDLERPPLWVLASRSGFDDALRRRAEHGEILLIEPDDLFAPDLVGVSV